MDKNVKKILKEIDISWKRGTLSNNHSLCNSETVEILFHEFHSDVTDDAFTRLKNINSLFKLLSSVDDDSEHDDIRVQFLKSEVMKCLKATPSVMPLHSSSIPNTGMSNNFIVLFHEGPTARAYLETIHELGIRPRKIIHLISSINLKTLKPLPRYLPNGLRTFYGEALQTKMMHYWAQTIFKKHRELVSEIEQAVEKTTGFNIFTQRSARILKPLSAYSDTIEKVMISSLKDPALSMALSKESGVILFTGGGIMPSSLLATTKRKFIHIHPGFLPDIRGADGVLWSILTRNRLSATAFYMSPGIDQGEIILPCWLPAFKLNCELTCYDVKTVYRAIYAYLDPWVRCFVLRSLLTDNSSLSDIASVPQDSTIGETFYFMHPMMQEFALIAHGSISEFR